MKYYYEEIKIDLIILCSFRIDIDYLFERKDFSIINTLIEFEVFCNVLFFFKYLKSFNWCYCDKELIDDI